MGVDHLGKRHVDPGPQGRQLPGLLGVDGDVLAVIRSGLSWRAYCSAPMVARSSASTSTHHLVAGLGRGHPVVDLHLELAQLAPVGALGAQQQPDQQRTATTTIQAPWVNLVMVMMISTSTA